MTPTNRLVQIPTLEEEDIYIVQFFLFDPATLIMAKLKTVLSVNMYCPKCKTEVLKAVTKLSGVDQVMVDGEKGTLTVIGEVDPVLITTKVRKTGKVVNIVTVGPPKKPDSPKKTGKVVNIAYPCPPCGCQLVSVSYLPSYNDGMCSIL